MKGKDCLGMDFTGGSSISYLVNKGDVSVKEAEDVVNKLALTQKATVQEVAESTDSSKVNILVNFSDNAQDKTEITSALKKSFPVLDNAPFSEETIGQSMGYDTLITSAWALFFGILGIMIYLTVRFEWTFAIGAVIALTHDVLLVLGLVIISGTELNVIHIGALLTVAGYSINDKIIVFDRIREYIRYADPNDSAEQIMNEAINQTLSRTSVPADGDLDAYRANGDLDSYYGNLFFRLQSGRWAHNLILTCGWNDASLNRTAGVAGTGMYSMHGSTSGSSCGAFYEGTYDLYLN